jgi:hypothetical protein
LDQELRRIAEKAVTYCRDGEELAGIIPVEPGSGGRVYRHGEETSWLVIDASGKPVVDRALVKDAVSIAALVELAEEAGSGENGEPEVATLARLDSLGAEADNPVAFAEAMKCGAETVNELIRDVERGYKIPLQ